MKASLVQNGWAIPLVAIGVAAGYAFFFFLPQQRAIAELAQQVASQQEFIDQTATLAPAIAATEQMVKASLEYGARWDAASPSDASMPALYGRIVELAKEAGVTTSRFDPDTPVSLERLRRIPLTIGLSGQFHQIAQFLESLERLPQTVWVEQLRMVPGSEDGQHVECELLLEIFADNPKKSGQVSLSR